MAEHAGYLSCAKYIDVRYRFVRELKKDAKLMMK